MAFRMYLTDTDHEVLQFVEEYGAITINQCRNMFYNKQIRGYEIARRRLARMVQYKKLNVYRDMDLDQNVYTMGKKLTQHGLLALDYLSELKRLGVNIVFFEQEQQWMNNKYFSDAFCCYYYKDKVYFDLVEVVRTKTVDAEKYKNIYNSKEAHILSDEIYTQMGGKPRNLFPRLVVIDNVRHKNDLYINDNVTVIQLDFKLNNIIKLLV